MESFIEYLERLADFEQNCTIKFRGDNGGISIIQTRLRDIRAEGDEGYIKTANGLKINISRLIEVNGRLAQNIC